VSECASAFLLSGKSLVHPVALLCKTCYMRIMDLFVASESVVGNRTAIDNKLITTGRKKRITIEDWERG